MGWGYSSVAGLRLASLRIGLSPSTSGKKDNAENKDKIKIDNIPSIKG